MNVPAHISGLVRSILLEPFTKAHDLAEKSIEGFSTALETIAQEWEKTGTKPSAGLKQSYDRTVENFCALLMAIDGQPEWNSRTLYSLAGNPTEAPSRSPDLIDAQAKDLFEQARQARSESAAAIRLQALGTLLSVEAEAAARLLPSIELIWEAKANALGFFSDKQENNSVFGEKFPWAAMRTSLRYLSVVKDFETYHPTLLELAMFARVLKLEGLDEPQTTRLFSLLAQAFSHKVQLDTANRVLTTEEMKRFAENALTALEMLTRLGSAEPIQAVAA